jgi:DNA-binding XRE family transcriptional regulator
MKRRKDPEGYPGDYAVRMAFAEAVRTLKQEAKDRPPTYRPRFEIEWMRRAFGVRLRELRGERRMTLTQLADASNVPERLIAAMERGRGGDTPLGDIIRLCLGLKYEATQFFSDMEQIALRLERESRGS